MTASSFDAALKGVLTHEGGNDDDPRDPGGRTSRGILQREWNVWRQTRPDLPSDVWQAPQDQVEAIYRQKYWDALHCDELPAGVDYAVFDYGVNSGIGRSAKVLQALVGVDQDGEIGPLTLAAAARINPKDLVGRICDERLSFLRGLKTWATFGRGWSTRIAEVRAAALDMAAHAPAQLQAIASAPQAPVEPPWLTKARGYIGFHEVSGNRGIEEFIALAHTGNLGDPWCAIFANGMLEAVGVPGTRSAMARSFEHDAHFDKLSKPILGCIGTMWRGSPTSGSGHVGFYVGQDSRGILLLAGNQGDQVDIEPQPPGRFTGYWWPKSVPQTLPEPTPMTDPIQPQPQMPTVIPPDPMRGVFEQIMQQVRAKVLQDIQQHPEVIIQMLTGVLGGAQGQTAQPPPPPTGTTAPPASAPAALGPTLVKVLPMLGIHGGIAGLVGTFISIALGVAGSVPTSQTTGTTTSIFGGMLASGLLAKLFGKKT